MNLSQQNYSATERECLAVVLGIKEFRTYLFGQHFTVVTDHHSLLWLMKIKDPTGRLARWALKLQQYNFDIQHRPGRQHANVDALSRISYVEVREIEIPNNFYKMQRQDTLLESIRQFLKHSKVSKDNKHRKYVKEFADLYIIKNKLLYKRVLSSKPGRQNKYVLLLAIPQNFTADIMTTYHNDYLSGHLGVDRTFNHIKEHYYWPHIYQDIKKWIKHCQTCARKKGPKQPVRGPMISIPAQRKFQLLGVHNWTSKCYKIG
jgi:hypothetical protein